MLDSLVRRLWRGNDSTSPKLTKEQKQSVRDGLSLFGWMHRDADAATKKIYSTLTSKLLESEEGYDAFKQWLAAAPAWQGIMSKSDPNYLRVSEELLQVASIDSLLRFADFIRRISPNVHSLFRADYLSSASETAINIARNHPYALDAWLDTAPDVLAVLEQDDAYPTGEASKIYFELSERIFHAKPIEVSKKTLESVMPLQQAGVLVNRFFESCLHANTQLDSDSYINWLNEGMQLLQEDPKQVRAYFSINSQLGQAALRKHVPGIGLDEVKDVLQFYSRALAGTGFTLKPMNGNILERPHTDGRNIWLPGRLHGYGTKEDNFQAYKVLATIQAAKVEFGTFALEDKDIQSLVEQLEVKYNTHAAGDTPLQHFYNAFPHPELAQTLFELIEGKRIINKIRENYRGIRATLDAVMRREIELRPLPKDQSNDGIVALEALAQYFALDAIPPTTPMHLKSIVEALYQLASQVTTLNANVVASLYATAACYELFKIHENKADEKIQQAEGKEEVSAELLHANIKDEELKGIRPAYQGEFEVIPILEGDAASKISLAGMAGNTRTRNGHFTYPEWSIIAGDYLLNWCEVKEFELHPAVSVPPLRNEALRIYMTQLFERMYTGLSERQRHEPEGEDINIDAAIEFMTDRKAGVSRDPDFYIHRIKHPKGIAAAFLIDASSSALDMLDDGRRVIDAERESLELLVAGMEQVGHTYGIFGFSGNERNDVRVSVVKRLDEKFERGKLYALEPIPSNSVTTNENPITSGTYTGPAIRHITQLLAAREEAITVLFLLTDSGVEADDYHGEYARADVHMAFLEAQRKRIYPFAISFGDTQREKLTQMYGRNFVEIMQPAQLARQLPQIYLAMTR